MYCVRRKKNEQSKLTRSDMIATYLYSPIYKSSKVKRNLRQNFFFGWNLTYVGEIQKFPFAQHIIIVVVLYVGGSGSK